MVTEDKWCIVSERALAILEFLVSATELQVAVI